VAYTTPTFSFADLVAACGGVDEIITAAALMILSDRILGATTRTAPQYAAAAAAAQAGGGTRTLARAIMIAAN
jgi:hypothetical protein